MTVMDITIHQTLLVLGPPAAGPVECRLVVPTAYFAPRRSS
jgi:hypothetical protein